MNISTAIEDRMNALDHLYNLIKLLHSNVYDNENDTVKSILKCPQCFIEDDTEEIE
jgi:hypothetical protein